MTNLSLRAKAEIELRDRQLAEQARKQRFLDRYYNRPDLFVLECIRWKGDNAPTSYQLDVLRSLVVKKRYSVRGPHGLGKGQPRNSIVWTPSGQRTIGELQLDDEVCTPDGNTAKVIGIYPQGVKDVYEFTFYGDIKVRCDDSHLWKIKRQTPSGTCYPWEVENTKTIVNYFRLGHKFHVPLTQPVQFGTPLAQVDIDPYLLGLLIGDGCLTDSTPSISVAEPDIIEYCLRFGGTESKYKDECAEVSIPHIRPQLRELGLDGKGSSDKFVPDKYKFATIEERFAILRGLMDSDGWVTKDGSCGFGNVSKQLCNDVAFLARSLGFKAKVSKPQVSGYKNAYGERIRTKDSYEVHINGFDVHRLFRTERKHIRAKTIQNYSLNGGTAKDKLKLEKIEYVGQIETVCIKVDHVDELYLTNDFVVTHNTAVLAWIVHWFVITSEVAEIDWKCPTLASVWRQLEKYLWPEIAKWSKRIAWSKIPRAPYTRDELLTLQIKGEFGESFALASKDYATLEGSHASRQLYLFDEAKIIPVECWNVAEMALTSLESYWIACSTPPQEPSGVFYEIHSGLGDHGDWTTRWVTIDECIAAGRLTLEWKQLMERKWHNKPIELRTRVYGELVSLGSEWGVIDPQTLVDAIARRTAEVQEMLLNASFAETVDRLGIDVGRGGDPSVAAIKADNVLVRLEEWQSTSLMTTVGKVIDLLTRYRNAVAVIDVIGIGAGVYDRLAEMPLYQQRIIPYNGQKRAMNSDEAIKDETQTFTFYNTRSYAYWNMKELLDPEGKRNAQLVLIDDAELKQELLTPTYKYVSDGVIQVEPKDAVMSRLGRSPNKADAVVMAFFDSGLWRDLMPFSGAQAFASSTTGDGLVQVGYLDIDDYEIS